MTDNEMREKLIQHCKKEKCGKCELFETDYDCGVHSFFYMNNEKIKECFNLVFGKEKHDNVEHPSHYETGKYECIEVMIEVMGVDAVKDFCVCNAFKYIYRHKRKNGVEDLEKAKWYINKYLELAKEEAEQALKDVEK